MSIPDISGSEYRGHVPPANIEIATEQAVAAPAPTDNLVQNMGPPLAQMVANLNQRMGGTNPLLQETQDLLQAIAVKLDHIYFEPRNKIEFYHPQLRLADLMHIGAVYCEPESYECNMAWVDKVKGSIAFSVIGLGRYRDQVDILYEELLKTHPQEQRMPIDKSYRSKYSGIANRFKFSSTIQDELFQRKKNQDRIMQDLINHLDALKDPGIERVYRVTPNELFEVYGFTLQGAAHSDAVIIIHKKVPPEEQKGMTFYIRQKQERRAKMNKVEDARRYQEDREKFIEQLRLLKLQGPLPPPAEAHRSVRLGQASSSAPPIAITEAQEVNQAPSPIPEPEENRIPTPVKAPQGFFLRIWARFKEFIYWLFCWCKK